MKPPDMPSEANPPIVNHTKSRFTVLRYRRLGLDHINWRSVHGTDHCPWYRLAAALIHNAGCYVDLRDYCDDAPTEVCRWLVGNIRFRVEQQPDAPQLLRWTGEPLRLPALGRPAEVDDSLRAMVGQRETAKETQKSAWAAHRRAEFACKEARQRLHLIDATIQGLKEQRREVLADAFFSPKALGPRHNQRGRSAQQGQPCPGSPPAARTEIT